MSGKHVALIVVMAALAPVAALAGHGKAGLWSTSTTMSMNGMPPQSHSGTYCMTAAEVNMDHPKPPPGNSGCSFQNMHATGNTMSADMVCHGQMESTGHFSTTYDGPEHYTAKFSINTGGMTMTSSIEGKWLKADCAGAAH